MSFNHMNNNQPKNDDEDDFPICQAPIEQVPQESNPHNQVKFGPAFDKPKSTSNTPLALGNSNVPTTNMGAFASNMGHSGVPNNFGNCCGPPRTMAPTGILGFNNIQTNVPQGFSDNRKHNIQEIYSKLSQARNKIAELNKFLDEIYETLPKIQ